MRALVRQSPRDSRNLAVALALLALAAVMFLVTMVKFEEQMHIATQPPGGSGTKLNPFGDPNGTVEIFDRGSDRVGRGDVAGIAGVE
jgi:hypothetical protein